jgi:hypothetical protein
MWSTKQHQNHAQSPLPAARCCLQAQEQALPDPTARLAIHLSLKTYKLQPAQQERKGVTLHLLPPPQRAA